MSSLSVLLSPRQKKSVGVFLLLIIFSFFITAYSFNPDSLSLPDAQVTTTPTQTASTPTPTPSPTESEEDDPTNTPTATSTHTPALTTPTLLAPHQTLTALAQDALLTLTHIASSDTPSSESDPNQVPTTQTGGTILYGVLQTNTPAPENFFEDEFSGANPDPGSNTASDQNPNSTPSSTASILLAGLLFGLCIVALFIVLVGLLLVVFRKSIFG